MKKLFIAAVAVLALASCKKDYTCTYSSNDIETYSGMGNTQANVQKTACEALGGTWSSK